MKIFECIQAHSKIRQSTISDMRVRNYGFLNRDKIIYYIKEENENFGFFAMYRYWVEYLYFADICGYTPVICAGNQFAYKEKNIINKTTNSFEYFFLQPGAVSLHEAKHSNKVVMSDIMHREMIELVLTGKTNNYKYNNRYLFMMAHIVKKYMRFNEITNNYIFESLKKLEFGESKILGVHIRGTDFRAKYNDHPVYATEEEFFTEIDCFMRKGSYDKIFLATDDVRILKNFQKKYGKSLCFYEDTKRNDINRSVAFSYDIRENHKYWLGLEVIRDMYTLSMCEGFVAGISQVAICAQINKLSRGEHYNDIKIIDNGIYRNNHRFFK